MELVTLKASYRLEFPLTYISKCYTPAPPLEGSADTFVWESKVAT